MADAQAAYYHNPREDLLPLIPDGIKRTLDVGCASGAFGEMLKARFGVEAWGIEEVAEVAELAKPRLDHVLAGDAVERLNELPKGHFDLISFNDVLEHMAWPDRALEAARDLLSPSGVIVASIPNLRYWHNLYHLIAEGDFRYEDSGIRDRTHLRFYTKKSAVRLFGEAGFRVDRIEELHKTRSKPLRILCILTGGKFLDCYPLQFGIVARPR